eukprot:CCRYP_016870-RB/>CCRYP_016870-RB protein AED:0.00 eAED:0.00 QI:189/1/1/1/1/1/3/205/1440
MSSNPPLLSLVSVLLIQDASVAFAPASHRANHISPRSVVLPHSRHAGRQDRRYSSQEFTTLNSVPIRKSGSLFGLFDFPSMKNASAPVVAVSEGSTTDAGSGENVTTKTLKDLAIDDDDYWIESAGEDVKAGTKDKKCNSTEEEKVTASDDSETTITILHHKKRPAVDEARSRAFTWDEGGMQKQREDLNDLSSSSINDLVDEEEEIDEIANSLLMSPPMELTADKSTLSEKREMIKMKAAQMNQKEAESIKLVENEFFGEGTIVTPEQSTIEEDVTTDVASSRREMENDNDRSLIAQESDEVSDECIPSPFKAFGNNGTSTKKDDYNVAFESRPLSPTHSIQEDYAKMKENEIESNDAASGNEDELVGEMEIAHVVMSMDKEGVDFLEADNLVENNLNNVSDAAWNASSITSSFVDDEVKSPVEDERQLMLESLGKQPVESTNVEVQELKESNQNDGDDDDHDSTSPLQTFISTATAFLPPTPPFVPPSDSNILNSSSANSNLVEINARLQQTLHNQRGDLGRLRRKINDLERQLIRANRSKVTKIEDEVNARVNTLREECKRQVVFANETVALLEKEVGRLRAALEESSVGLMLSVEEKERVRAEFGFLTKAYVDVKHAFDTQKKEWKDTIEKLEQQLADATQQLERYQKETRQWKDECINKANLLDSSNIRMIQLQSTIDGLQSVIRTKEDEIKSMTAAAARDRQRIISINKQELRDEYESLLAKKSKKIGELRMALRSANGKRRHVERVTQRETSEALKVLRREMESDMDELKALLTEKEAEVVGMKQMVEEAELVVEERERLLAEVMFLTKSVEELQTNFTILKHSYEDETVSLRQAHSDKADEIEGLVQLSSANIARVSLMESRLDKLSAELQGEQSLNAKKSIELSALAAKLGQAEATANDYNKQLDLLRDQTQSYQTKVIQMQAQIRELEDQKLSLEQALTNERERSEATIDEKVTCIAILDQELAEKINELFTLNVTLTTVSHQLEEMSARHAFEKERADSLEASMQLLKENTTSTADKEPTMNDISRLEDLYKRKTVALAQKNLLSEQVINNKLGEILVLKKKLDEVTLAAPSTIAENQTIAQRTPDIADLTISSRKNQAQAQEKLLLQLQTIQEQQGNIDALTSKIESMEKSTSGVRAQAVETKNDNESVIKHLEQTLEQTKNDFSLWKAKANEEILTTNNVLKSKEERILQLQDEVDRLIKTQEDAARTSSEAEEVASKAKEKLLLKNQLLKEKDDIIAHLNTQFNDVQFEKKRIEQTLQDEMKRNEEFYLNHELQIQATKDKLSKQHAADINRLEKEMNETVYQLEMEIKSLKNRMRKTEVPSSVQSSATSEKNSEAELVKELQAALQQSKEKEVALINKNMMMKQKIQNLEAQSKLLIMSSSASGADERQKTEVELPSYYKEEGKRARIKRLVGGIWRRVFGRQNL